jgi:hypothetical protein
MLDDITEEWVFTTAQTDALLLNVTSTERISILGVVAQNAKNTTVNVSCRIGFATTTLPTVTNNSLTGNAGVFFSFGGVAPGAGAVRAIPAMGPIGVPVRITCAAATGGDFRPVITYRRYETT